MSVDYNNKYEEMEMSCDEPRCGGLDSFSGSYIDCIKEAKAAGWHFTNTGGDYTHECPDCNNLDELKFSK